MSAFPQLIHGRVVSNKVTVDKSKPNRDVLVWWERMNIDQQMEILHKHKPYAFTGSELKLYAQYKIASDDPTELFELENGNI